MHLFKNVNVSIASMISSLNLIKFLFLSEHVCFLCFRSILGPQRIGSIFIPGTHNSGAYGPIPGIFKKYVLNQNMDIWTQLVFGIRYFDLRIGYYQGDGYNSRITLTKG